jgi:hypothetical protein
MTLATNRLHRLNVTSISPRLPGSRVLNKRSGRHAAEMQQSFKAEANLYREAQCFIAVFRLMPCSYAAAEGVINSARNRSATACQLMLEKKASIYFGRSAGA